MVPKNPPFVFPGFLYAGLEWEFREVKRGGGAIQGFRDLYFSGFRKIIFHACPVINVFSWFTPKKKHFKFFNFKFRYLKIITIILFCCCIFYSAIILPVMIKRTTWLAGWFILDLNALFNYGWGWMHLYRRHLSS